MDTALELRVSFEEGETLSEKERLSLLNESALVAKLTDQIPYKHLPAIFRLSCMSEIPYIQDLPEAQSLMKYVDENLSTENGFTYTGKDDEIVPCYNAMILEAFVRLGQSEHLASQKALNWIKKYQIFERNSETNWQGKGICKHGGCMKAVSCYIGIGKTVRALLTYRDFAKDGDPEVDTCIQQGVDYMLKHKLYRRLSNGKPISAHITELMFPQSYMLSTTDLCYIIGKAGVMSNPLCEDFLLLLDEKKVDQDKWKIDHLYKYEGHIPFEGRRKSSEWLSYLLPLWLT